MKTLYRWKDSKGNASEPMTLEAAQQRDKNERHARNPLGFYRPSDYQTFIYPVEVTDTEYAIYTR